MTRIYRYILVDDLGMAPCPANGLITLATCKPQIRRGAELGDWVLGFRPGSLERGLVLWAGRVARVVPHGDYERQFRGRPDAVYREKPDGSFERLVPDYHPTQAAMDRDLSGPVLVFDDRVSRYSSGQAKLLPSGLMHLAAAGRGHRVNGTLPDDVNRLEAWLAEVAPTQDLTDLRRAPSKRGRRCDTRQKWQNVMKLSR